MDFQALADDLGFDLEEFKELVELFLKTAAEDLSRLYSAIEKKDPIQAEKAIHSIKGAAGNLGFSTIHECAKKMEIDAKNNRLSIVSESAKVLENALKIISNQSIK
jgi:HPt (histidine-containing phosphotransfer) domain-containing protein